LGDQEGPDAFDDVFVGNRAMFLDAFGSVLLIFAAETHNDIHNHFAEVLILSFVALLNSQQFCETFLFKPIRFGPQPIRLLMIQRAHIGFGHGRSGAQNALFATTGAGTIARDERFVIAPDHQMVAEGGFGTVYRAHHGGFRAPVALKCLRLPPGLSAASPAGMS